ncbi:MAG: EamA/RhaT family transporter [Spirochaetaceae bacterium]|nr:MAG: EamA/RhaT family transporter [Spirochaetaceae bacterium]
MLWGAAAGLAGALGLAFLYKGLARGIIAVVSPLAAVVGAVVPVLAGVVLSELPGLLGQIGIAVSIPAIFLLSWERVGTRARSEVLMSVRYGSIAGLCFGVFFILISRPAAAAGMWPLVAARAAALPVLLFLIVAGRRPLRVARVGMSSVILAGALDMSANISFVLALHYGLLSVVAVITSLAPAPTVILGRVFLGQTLTPARISGLVLAVLGVVLLSV